MFFGSCKCFCFLGSVGCGKAKPYDPIGLFEYFGLGGIMNWSFIKLIFLCAEFIVVTMTFACNSKITATLLKKTADNPVATEIEVNSSPATNLKWVETSPQNQINISAQWTKSEASKLANQKIQFFSDPSCGTLSGDLVNLNSSSTESFSFVGVNETTYTYKIYSLDNAGAESISSCSDPMVINVVPAVSPALIQYSNSTLDIPLDYAIEERVLTYNPSDNLVFSSIPTLPSGLTLNSVTGSVSGRPTAKSTLQTYTQEDRQADTT